MNAKQLAQLLQNDGYAFLDCRFMDFPGRWQHATYPVSQLSAANIAEGFGFDGSLLQQWQDVNEGDMVLLPDPRTARADPFAAAPSLSVICDLKDPVTRKTYSRDPRSIARKAEAHLRETGVADAAWFAPEVEFYVFDGVRFDQRMNTAYYAVDSPEGIWGSGRDSGGRRSDAQPEPGGFRIRPREGAFPLPPHDTLHDLRAEMVSLLEAMRIGVKCHHHEAATGGQCEIDLLHDGLLEMADKMLFLKQVVRQAAARSGRTATFMPKPLFDENGSGLHTHFSLWKDDQPLFAGNRYAGMSQAGLHALGGILRHTPALLAFTNPTTNSYKRFTPGNEAPTFKMYASRNRDAAVRIPVYGSNPATRRLELRCPDPSANPYLAFAAITMAAIDGIQNQIDPGDPIDAPPPGNEGLVPLPASLGAALDALEADHGFLTAGDVFPQPVIDRWIHDKREREILPLDRRPHPYEFSLYYDA